MLLEKLIGAQLVKKFPALNGTRMFIRAYIVHTNPPLDPIIKPDESIPHSHTLCL